MRTKRSTRLLLTGLASMAATALAPNVFAGDFEFGDGWKGSYSATLSYSSAWRIFNADPALYGAVDGALAGLPTGKGNNTVDEGDVNYKKGEQFTSLVKLIAEVGAQKNDMGFLLRGKLWYDYALEHNSVALGSQNNGYVPGAPLSDSGYDNLNKFKGFSLLDAYVYDTYEIADKPLQVRLGNQVVNWGESLFIQGVNQINPIDVPSYHKPGAQLKEVFIPVPILYGSQSLGEYGNLEAFYQFKFRSDPLDLGCGSYWSLALGNIGQHPGSCNNSIGLAPPGNAVSVATGAFIHTVDSKNPNDGEFGLAYRFTVPKLDTEFGVYAERIDSRTPIVSITHLGAGAAPGMPFDTMWEYPEAERLFGLSAATNLLGWSTSAEYSQTSNAPAQIDGNDLLYAGLAAGGALATAFGLPAGTQFPLGPDGNGAMTSLAGSGYLSGYTLTTKRQLNLNTVSAGNGLLGAGQYVFVAEAAVQTNGLNLTGPGALRYNRPFILGPGTSASYSNTCVGNISPAGCQNDGYTTHFAWGYRLKLDLTYNDVFAGITVIPSVFWSQDVKGYSMDSQFIQDRRVLGLGTKFSYNKKYTLDLGATLYNHNAQYDALHDRDFYSASVSATF